MKKNERGGKRMYVVWFDMFGSGMMKEYVAVGGGVVRPVSTMEKRRVGKFWRASMSSRGVVPKFWFKFSGAPIWSTVQGVFPIACVDKSVPKDVTDGLNATAGLLTSLQDSLLVGRVKAIDKKDVEKEIRKLKVLCAL